MDLFFYMNVFLIILAVISIIYYLVNSYYSIYYEQNEGKNPVDRDRVTALVPVYNEDPELFTSAIEAIRNQGIAFIVVGDACDEPYRSITEINGGKFLYLNEHGGKRKAVSRGIELVETDFVLLVDSDAVVSSNTVEKMLPKFDSDVGGIGANLSVKRSSNWLSYSAEFVERTREVLFRALSSHGNVMLLDGACVMYRTSVVKPFILSKEYTDHRVFGRKSQLGDDRQVTGYIIRSGYKAIKAYDVNVEVQAPKNVSKFVKQNVRWARSNWVNFFREIFNGTARKAGRFYTFDLLYTFMLPLLFVVVGFIQAYLFFHLAAIRFLMRGDIHDFISVSVFYNTLAHLRPIFFLRALMTLANYMATAVFTVAIAFRINKERLKTFAFGIIAMIVMLVTTLYGLITIWKQNGWMTR